MCRRRPTLLKPQLISEPSAKPRTNSFAKPRLWSLIISATILLITLATPALLTWPKRLWLRLGLLLNRVVGPVVLAFLFYFVVTPMGALMRMFGVDSLRLRRGANSSYWIKRDPPGPKPDSLSNQF